MDFETDSETDSEEDDNPIQWCDRYPIRPMVEEILRRSWFVAAREDREKLATSLNDLEGELLHGSLESHAAVILATLYGSNEDDCMARAAVKLARIDYERSRDKLRELRAARDEAMEGVFSMRNLAPCASASPGDSAAAKAPALPTPQASRGARNQSTSVPAPAPAPPAPQASEEPSLPLAQPPNPTAPSAASSSSAAPASDGLPEWAEMNEGLEDERAGFLTALGNLQRNQPNVLTYVHKVTLTAPSTATVTLKPCMKQRNAVCAYEKSDKSKRRRTHALAGELWTAIRDHHCKHPDCPDVSGWKRKREG